MMYCVMYQWIGKQSKSVKNENELIQNNIVSQYSGVNQDTLFRNIYFERIVDISEMCV